jgi:hypothetical protein
VSTATPGHDEAIDTVSRRHLRIGWWGLLAFATLGLALEGLHGLKVGIYLDVSNETRRLLWTLAHAHGTLLALLNVAFSVTVSALPDWRAATRSVASRCLLGALLLLPLGFFLGGTFIHDGDPGLGVLLAPPGALLLLIALFLTARAVSAGGVGPRP